MWYNKSLKELYSELGSSRAGLTESQAKERLIKYGKNELLSKKKKSFLRRYFEALCDRMTVVLLIAAAVSSQEDSIAKILIYSSPYLTYKFL